MSKKLLIMVMLVFIGMFLGACGEAISVDGLVPNIPDDGGVPEVPGDGGTNSLMLSWDAPTTNEDGTPLEDLAGYRLYYGTESRQYSHVVDVGRYTTVEVGELSANTWYISVTAYDFYGNESDFSTEIHHTFY